jgi:hypothetical protein
MSWLAEGDALNWLNGGLDGDAAGYLKELAESVARQGMLGFEVGGFTGWTASQVLPVFKENNGHFYLLDWFKGSVETQVAGYHWPNFDSKKVLLQTLSNFETQDFDGLTTFIIGSSLDIPPICADGALDYVYIGADHRYTPFKKDLEAWLPKLRKGGVICGHAFTGWCPKDSPEWQPLCDEPEQDFYNTCNFHFGVLRAVTELLPGYDTCATVWSKKIG